MIAWPGLDQVACEVPLDPLAEEGVGDPDLERIAVDPQPHPLAEPEPEPALPSLSATAARSVDSSPQGVPPWPSDS